MTWEENLERWLRDHFHEGQEFRLEEVYEAIPAFQSLYPENNTVRQSLRSTLQGLRDIGRVEFVDQRGLYKLIPIQNAHERLPERSREAMLAAMKGFDSSTRHAPNWRNWESNRAHKYAIKHDGKLYPVKQIVSIVTAIPLKKFGGGAEANSYAKSLGFEIVKIRDEIGDSEGKPKYWAIAPGEGARLWQEFLDEKIIAIGWGFMGDLTEFDSKKAMGERIQDVKERQNVPVNDALACYEFAKEMREGDYVIAKKGVSELLGLGVVRGPYEYRPGRREYPQVRTVEWLAVGSWELPEEIRLPLKTLTDVSDYSDLIEFVRTVTEGKDQTPRAVVSEAAPYGLAEALDGLFIDAKEFERIVDTLARKKNIVIQGPPGVGKTFVARRVAYALMGRADSTRVGMVQFHQSYSYEDFMQGWRPTKNGFELKNGVFFDFCRRAQSDPANQYVFVIDEINRGNLSKIFGELMMLVEADKRKAEWAIPLTYSANESETFFVPSNMFLIGLMNTADRSLAMVDYALRRRFGFLTLEPSFTSPRFAQYLMDKGASESTVDQIKAKMKRLNDAITSDEKNLGPGFEIGHSFFCPTGNEESLDEAWIKRVIEDEIAPLLREYWFDKPAQATEWIAQLQA